MRKTLLSTAAAAALALSFGVASAQNMEKGSAGASSGAPAGAVEKGAAADEHAPAAQRNSGTMEKSKHPAAGQAQGAEGGKMDSKPEGNRAAQRSGEPNQAMPQERTGMNAKPGESKTVGAAPSSETKLTTEQRTQIREKVIATGPRVTNVNFALNVGTVVPRDVRFAEVPTVIIDLHPEWRGYSYFIVNDEVVIVDRSTLRIVAILDV